MATQAEVAEHLGITERWLRDLQKHPGAPKIESVVNTILMPGDIFIFHTLNAKEEAILMTMEIAITKKNYLLPDGN